jgi:hypothetical protein
MARRASISTLAFALALAACNATSPLVWSAADQEDDDNSSEETPPSEPDPMDAGAPPPPPPPMQMDGGVVIAEPKRPPCGTGPGCDPTNYGGETCETLGAGEGRLLCDPTTCLFEVGLCTGLPDDASVGRPCGTGPGCNVRDLGGETCGSLNMGSGFLSCDRETCQLDTSMCSANGGFGGAGSVFGGNNFGGGANDGGTFFGGGNFFGGGDNDGGTFFGGGFFGGGNDGGFFGGGFFGGNDDDVLDAGTQDPLDAGVEG